MKIGFNSSHDVCTDLFQRARILVTSVFFMWGLSYGLLEVLNKYFQELLNVTKAQSGLLQAAYFSAYFLTALPAAGFMERTGYKSGLLLGLCLYATGALLFIPASFAGQFIFFLGALFVLACGLACLETASNPFMVELGNPVDASKRLNIAQSFCGLGCSIGPLLGAAFLFNETPSANSHPPIDSIRFVYAGLACIVIMIAIFIKNSAILDEHTYLHKSVTSDVALLTDKPFAYGVIALFFYIAAQVGVGSLFINFVTEYGESITSQRGAFLLSTALFIFVLGRFTSAWLMGYVKPHWLLRQFSLVSLALCAIVITGCGSVAVLSLTAMFFFMSMMFPTIFSIAIKNLGARTKRGSSILMMTMIGGAISPYLMGHISDTSESRFAYIVPFICFIFIFLYSQFLGMRKDSARKE